MSDEQKKYVTEKQADAVAGLTKIKNALQVYVDDTEGKVALSETMKNSICDYLGMTDSKEDVKKLIGQIDKLITFIDGLTLDNFKYDSNRHQAEDADGTKHQWVAYVCNKVLPIYLCPYFFENKKNNKTSAGTLIHEVTHIIFKAKDITYNDQECKELRKNQKTKKMLSKLEVFL